MQIHKTFIISLGLQASCSDSSLFIHSHNSILVYFLVSVYDLLIIGNSSLVIRHVITTPLQPIQRPLASSFFSLGCGGHFLTNWIFPISTKICSWATWKISCGGYQILYHLTQLHYSTYLELWISRSWYLLVLQSHWQLAIPIHLQTWCGLCHQQIGPVHACTNSNSLDCCQMPIAVPQTHLRLYTLSYFIVHTHYIYYLLKCWLGRQSGWLHFHFRMCTLSRWEPNVL